jgi:outer membrane protein insertion porin family
LWAEYRDHEEMGSTQGISFRLAGGTTTQGSFGADGSRLPRQWQFQAGGVGTLRGHPFQEFRGDRLVLATVEYGIEVGARARPVVFLDGGKAWNEIDAQSGGIGGSGPLALDGGVGVLLGADGFRLDVARDLRRERAPARVTVRLFHTL